MKKLLFISLLFLLVSCKEKEVNKEQSVYVGDWYFDKIVDYDSSKTRLPKKLFKIIYGGFDGFSVVNDSTFDFRPGFYYEIENDKKCSENDHTIDRSRYYLGTRTSCKLGKTKILFFDKSLKKWQEIRVKQIVGDTMILYGNMNVTYKMVRKQKPLLNTKQYDAITLDRSPCFGSCPFNATYIDRKGNYYFKGFGFNTQNENFHSQLDAKTTHEIFRKFDVIDINKLKDSYFVPASDGQHNVISFIKNGRIIKTIQCYIETPEELAYAINNLSYVYQQVKVDYDDKFIFGDWISFGKFKVSDKDYSLMSSESFSLEVALRNGTKIDSKINTPFELTFIDYKRESDIKSVFTDGQYYKFINKNNTTFTVDIGYNFIDRNPILKKDRVY